MLLIARRFRLGLLAAVLVLLAACATTTAGRGARGPLASTIPGGTSSSSGRGTCPAGYVQPDPNRPRVMLAFTVGANGSSVQGREQISFTPDMPITELVFRLTANSAPTVAEGNKVAIAAATADHGAGAATFSQDGAAASTQGGLLHIPFPSTIAAGTTVSADISFTVTLGQNAFDRLGKSGSFAWFASAQPLLAWERGYGWHTEPMLDFLAESATSEAMQTDLSVTAPAADTVIMSGDPQDGAASGAGVKTWHATIDAARDISVAVGPFFVSDATVGAVKLRVGAYSQDEGSALLGEFRRSITQLSSRFGPFPFPSLSVARLPAQGGGIEYPSSILMLDSSRPVAVHETAHQWFYAMVGNSQAQHAWLDEAFATYAEQLVDNDPLDQAALDEPGQVDKPTASYGTDANDYYSVTYNKGAAALLAARMAAGADKFDAAIRCYVNVDAWRIATPADLAAALAHLPAAVAVLKKAGAL